MAKKYPFNKKDKVVFNLNNDLYVLSLFEGEPWMDFLLDLQKKNGGYLVVESIRNNNKNYTTIKVEGSEADLDPRWLDKCEEPSTN
jgi:hypothetical protein